MPALGYLVNEQLMNNYGSIDISERQSWAVSDCMYMPIPLDVPHHLRITAHPQQNKFLYIILI